MIIVQAIKKHQHRHFELLKAPNYTSHQTYEVISQPLFLIFN